MTRRAISTSGDSPGELPVTSAIRDISGTKRSVSQLEFTPCMTAERRSSPIPVSIDGAASGEVSPFELRLNCMKTRFHISMKRSESRSSLLTGPEPKSHIISEHGPQGPVSPIAQKLSFSSRRKMRSAGTCFLQSLSASSSSRKTVA